MTTKATRTATTEPPASKAIPAPDTAAAASLYQQLRAHLAVLKLHDAAEALPGVLEGAAAERLSMTAALERLLAIEVDATEARRLAGRLRFACLPTPASLTDFDYDAATGVDRALIAELGTCRYLETATNVLLIGPPVSARPICRWGSPAPQRTPVTGPTSPAPPTWPPAATAPRSKAGGQPRCGSTPGQRCS
jgi:hypothetical protein